MKILVASTSFPLRRGDSLSPFLWEYCVSLKKRGWNVTVVVPHHKGVPLEENWDGIRVKRFKYLPESMETLAYSGGLLPGLKRNPFRIFGIMFFIRSMRREILRTLGETEYDVLNIHWLFPAAFWAGSLNRMGKTSIVFTGHGTDVQLSKKYPFDIFAGKALEASSALTLNSEYMLGILEGKRLPDKIGIVPMGIDTKKFEVSNSKPSDSNKILFIGRLVKQKGVLLLIQAFGNLLESYSSAVLEIIGYGPEKQNLVDSARSLGLMDRITFSDAIEHDKLAERYRSARVLAFPSLIGEGFGMTVAEAAACGIPAVTFGLGGTAELVVDGQTGLITEQNVESFTAGLKRLYSNDKLVDSLGKGARERIENNYSWDIIGDKFDMFLKGVVEK